MRAVTFLALVGLMTVSLSGCLGFGDDTKKDDQEEEHGEHDHCDQSDVLNYSVEECTEMPDLEDGNTTNEPVVPNQLPVANLTLTTDDGMVLNATSYITPGMNITFSAMGSTDPDGVVSLVGLTVVDSNGTRTAQLFENGAFVNATMRFDSVGPVNITVRVLDDDGEGVIRSATAAVNDLTTDSIEFDSNAPTGSADTCQAPGASSGAPPLITNAYSAKSSFSVQKGAQWISAKVTSGSGEIAICTPGDPGTKLSDAGTDVSSEDDTNSTMPVNAQYYIMVLKKGSGPGPVGIEVMVHYEAKPAAAAA